MQIEMTTGSGYSFGNQLGTSILKLPKTYCIIAIKMLIFLGVVYHSVANGEAETATLRDHIQRNMDAYLLKRDGYFNRRF